MAQIVMDQQLQFIMKIVQVLAGFGMVVGVIISVWSLRLQKRETIKQNEKMISQNNKIIKLLQNILNK